MAGHPYEIGNALTAVALAAHQKQAEAPELSYGLKGKLYCSQGGWLLLSVPNALARGAFDALGEQGVELPPPGQSGNFNAHISVMRPEEIETIPGGKDAITERGHECAYTLGRVRSVKPAGWEDMSQVWYIEVHSPELERLRRSYGLTSLPNDNNYRFHITFAVRRKNTLRENGTSKAASLIHYPEQTFRPPLRQKSSAHDAAADAPPAEARAEAATQGPRENARPTGKNQKDITPIITRQREELKHVDYCPHCQEEIGEKSMYCDADGYEYHRPCMDKGPIGFSESGRRLHALMARRPDLAGEKEASGDMLAFQAWKARGLSDEAADYRAGVSLELPADIPKGEICPHCGERMEYNATDEKCNHCGKSYPPEKLAAYRLPETAEEKAMVAKGHGTRLCVSCGVKIGGCRCRENHRLLNTDHNDKCPACEKQAVYDFAGVKELIDSAVEECTTPKSEEHAEAGNYQKGHLHVYGLPITIETGKGMTRSGTSKSGKKWSTLMKHSYGYIKRTQSKADGDHIDVFLNDDDPIYEKVFVVDQVDPETGDFDEHKCMLFFANAKEAEEAYLANYEDGWEGCGAVTEMSLEEFKDWCENGDTSQAVGKSPEKAAARKPRPKPAEPEISQAALASLVAEALRSTLPGMLHDLLLKQPPRSVVKETKVERDDRGLITKTVQVEREVDHDAGPEAVQRGSERSG